jgi:uncharacterized protein (UPF0332 family)
MSFDRYRVQSEVEADIGCTDLTKWDSYLQKFRDYEVNQNRKNRLILPLKMDASDVYFKAIFSLSDAINSLYHGRHSWAVIKLYYSVFFLLRCYLATDNVAFIKNKGIYTLRLSKGEKPQRRDGGKYLGESVSGDHKTTIVTFLSLFSDSDILLSNSINNKSVYEWLMDLRNQVNYRERVFTEPDNKYFFPSLFDKKLLKTHVEKYMKDEIYVYCFDEDHCALAMPLKLASIVRQRLFAYIDFEPIGSAKRLEIEKLLNETGLAKLDVFSALYEFGRE